MYNIVIIEDDPKDAERVVKALIPLGKIIQYYVQVCGTISAGKTQIEKGNTNLVLLDLEFTLAKETSIAMLDQIDPRIPVIVVSNLEHYQRQLQLKMNVVGFIPKAKIENQLIRMITEIWASQNMVKRPNEFVFPNAAGCISEAYDISNIIYIEVSGYKEYLVLLKNGQKKAVKSVSFRDLCDYISKCDIVELQPVSRNEVININYIKSVSMENNGRITLALLGMDRDIHIGKNYTAKFRDWYIE